MKTEPYLPIPSWQLRPQWVREACQLADDVQPIDAPEWLCAGSVSELNTSAGRFPCLDIVRRPQ